jgi:serine/threonine protein kinase
MSFNLIGQTLGKYRILEEIGRGGMGAVYKAHDTILDRLVAIKILAPHLTWDQEFVQRFLHEARAAARLKHPNIVTIHDVGQIQGHHFIAMEYLEGHALDEIIRRGGPLSPPRVARLVRQVADALDYAHGRGLIHRDVKPGNVIVSPQDHATLTDFGVARSLEGTRLTQSGAIVGTPVYMAPELVKKQPVGPATDVYALGVLAYEMLSGRPPFEGETPYLLYAHVYEEPRPLPQVNPKVSPAVGAVVQKALAKEPSQRYGSAGAFAKALGQAVGSRETEVVRKPPPPRPPSPPTARAGQVPLWPLFGALAAVLIVVLLIFTIREIITNPEMEAEATAQTATAQAAEETTQTALAQAEATQTVAAMLTPTETLTPTPMPTETPTTLRPTEAPTATPTGTLTPMPTDMPTPTPTDTPTPTVTETPTPTPTETPIPTPTHTPILTPTSIHTPPPTRTPTPTPIIYTVIQGDTLFSIADKYGTTVEAIAEANGLSLSAILHIGQQLIIPYPRPTGGPVPETPVISAGTVITHVVQTGDNLYSIANLYGTTVEVLMMVNGIKDPMLIQIGQELIISWETPTPTPLVYPVDLSNPANGSTQSGLVAFEWTWAGTLGPTETFDVRVCNLESCQPQFGITNTRDTRHIWCPEYGSGVYRWQVVVILREGDQIIGERALSEVWEFTWIGECGSPTPTPVIPIETPTPPPTDTSPTPTPALTITLLEPASDVRISGLVTFRWTWTGTLRSSEVFDVKVCKGEGCQPQFGKTNTRDTTWPNWCPDDGQGIYRWKVEVIDSDTKQPKGPASDIWEFTWVGGCGEPTKPTTDTPEPTKPPETPFP